MQSFNSSSSADKFKQWVTGAPLLLASVLAGLYTALSLTGKSETPSTNSIATPSIATKVAEKDTINWPTILNYNDAAIWQKSDDIK